MGRKVYLYRPLLVCEKERGMRFCLLFLCQPCSDSVYVPLNSLDKNWYFGSAFTLWLHDLCKTVHDLFVSSMKDKYSLMYRSNPQQQPVSSAWSSSAFVFKFNEETCSVAHSQSENNKGIAALSSTIKKIKTLLVPFVEKQQEQIDVWPPTWLCKL